MEPCLICGDTQGDCRCSLPSSKVGKRVEEMTDTEKALLTECPFCNVSFSFAWSEVDADGFCRVTCSGCEQYVEYKMESVEAEKELAGCTENQIYQMMVVIDHLHSMREIIRDRIIDIEREVEFIGGMNYQNPFYKGEIKGYSESLRLLGNTDFDREVK